MRVPEVRRLLVEVPARATGELRLGLRNAGNVPLAVEVASAPESPLFLPPLKRELPPGQRETLLLPLSEPGELLLRLAWGWRGVKEDRYLVRVVDSNNNEHYLDAVTPNTPIALLEERHLELRVDLVFTP